MTSNPLPPARRRPGSVGVAGGRGGADRRRRRGGRARRCAGRGGDPRTRAHPRLPEQPGGQRRGVLRRLVPHRRRGRRSRTATCALRGRLKEMIIRGGENISPYEIEAVLRSHPQVGEAVALRRGRRQVRPDRCGGRRPRRATPTPDELRRHARESLAAFKVPDRVTCSTEIPQDGDRQGAALAAGEPAGGDDP